MSANEPLQRIVIAETQHDDLHIELIARIDDNGDLVLEGYDRGKFVQEHFGDSDYEYWLKVPRDWKDTVLLYMLREHFENDAGFRAWLEAHNIPGKFTGY